MRHTATIDDFAVVKFDGTTGTKLWHSVIDGGAAAWKQTRTDQQVVGSSDDAREGIAAFREKRRPRWSGT